LPSRNLATGIWVPTVDVARIGPDEYGTEGRVGGLAGSDVFTKERRVIDHIVLAVPDLAVGVAEFHRRTGTAAVMGGSHVGIGTANYLVGLGNGAYLEIIGPDRDQPEPAQPRPFGIDTLTAPRVVTWCVRPPDFDKAIATAKARGYDPGPPQTMSRRTSDSTLLTWRLTIGTADPLDGLVPFLIDWGTTPHPTTATMPMLPLVSLAGQHPEPVGVRDKLAALDVDLALEPGPQPRLLLTLQCPTGPVVLG
jgi:hypothetical protein